MEREEEMRNEDGQRGTGDWVQAVDGLLREGLRESARQDEAFVRSVLSAVDGWELREKDGEGKRWKRVLSVAAGIAAGVAIAIAIFQGAASEEGDGGSLAQSRNVKGDVRILRDGVTPDGVPLVDGDQIGLDDRIICRDGATADIDFPDGTSFSLTGGRYVLSQGGNEQKRLRVEVGRILCAVTRQPDAAPMLFETPHGSGRVAGTAFQVAVGAETTRLHTLSGDVQVWRAGEEDAWTPVAAGLGVSMSAGSPLVALPVRTELLEPGDTVWLQQFNVDYGRGANIEGEMLSFREGGRLVSAIRSIPFGDGNATNSWNPDQWVSLELYSREALFRLPPDMEIALRIRAEKPGGIEVALTPTEPKFKYEHVITDLIDVGTEWIEIVVPGEAFNVYRESRPVAADLPIRSVGVYGFGTGRFMLERIEVRIAP